MSEERAWSRFPEVDGDCPFAFRLSNDHLDDHRLSRERFDRVDTIVAHTTGGTWASKQVKKNPNASDQDLLEYILDYYWRKGKTPRKSTSSHYFIWWDGRIFQLSDDHLRVGHVGVSGDERRAYLDGSWEEKGKAKGQSSEGMKGPISSRAVKEWKKAWPHYKSPQHLFGTRYVNYCSVGVEMAPCVVDGKARAEPIGEGYRFTMAQHQSFCALTVDVAKRWGWEGDWIKDPKGGPWSPRVAGHSDFDLYGRSTSRAGMWDPGGHRNPPWFDWTFVYRNIQTLLALQSVMGSDISQLLIKGFFDPIGDVGLVVQRLSNPLLPLRLLRPHQT